MRRRPSVARRRFGRATLRRIAAPWRAGAGASVPAGGERAFCPPVEEPGLLEPEPPHARCAASRSSRTASAAWRERRGSRPSTRRRAGRRARRASTSAACARRNTSTAARTSARRRSRGTRCATNTGSSSSPTPDEREHAAGSERLRAACAVGDGARERRATLCARAPSRESQPHDVRPRARAAQSARCCRSSAGERRASFRRSGRTTTARRRDGVARAGPPSRRARVGSPSSGTPIHRSAIASSDQPSTSSIEPTAASARARRRASRASTAVSAVPRASRLMACTVLAWPMRSTRPMRCSRRIGFQGSSRFTTDAAARLQVQAGARGIGGDEPPARRRA